MRAIVTLLAFASLAPAMLLAAPSFDPELSGLPVEWKYNPTKLEVIDSTTGSMSLSWFGRTGLSYFIQYSEDLQAWNFFPVVEAGHNEVISYGFQSTGQRFFVRLRALDAFGSGASWVSDSDGDGIPDYWELLYGFNPFDAGDGAGQGGVKRLVHSLFVERHERLQQEIDRGERCGGGC